MPIDAVSVLPEPHALAAKLGHALPHFASVDWQASVASTNQSLMAQVRQSNPNDDLGWPRLLGAHHQTAGRGRAGRPWQDQGGQALMFSCGFKTDLTLPQLAGLAPALGIASAEALREQLLAAGASPEVIGALRIKWPNDLMLADAKLAGILVESVVRQKQEGQQQTKPVLYLVAGMGLNVSGHHQLSNVLGRAVADLSQVGVQLDLVALVATLASAWQATLRTLASDGFAPFVDRIKPIDYLQGRTIDVMQQDVVLHTGCAMGVTGQGALALALASGAIEPVMVGDVSIRWQSPDARHDGIRGTP
jgi:BirA family transcriptional regulator, biotin operon repressor / biotin---[acetyl-CoA-carboxylase] ligase